MSNGSRRPPMIRGTNRKDNQFKLETSILVSMDTPNVDDVMDQIEKEIADLISDTANRSTSDWTFIDYEDAFSTRQGLSLGGTTYWVESFNVIVTVWSNNG